MHDSKRPNACDMRCVGNQLFIVGNKLDEKQSKKLKDLVEAPDTPTWKIKNYVVEETG